MSIRLLGPALAFALGIASGLPTAFAQSESEIALARKWFKEGEAAEKKNDCATALDRFEKALAIKATAQIHLHLGVCQEKLGKLVEAMGSYERALEKANAASLADVATVAKDQLDGLKPRLPTATITLAEPYPDATITLDGVPLASAVLGDKLPLNPGQHKLRATAPGRSTFEQGFSLAESESRLLPVTLAVLSGPARPEGSVEPKPASPAAPADTPTESGSIMPGIAFLAGGVLGLGTGVVLFVVAAGKDSDIDTICGGSDRLACPRAREDEINGDISTVETLRAFSFIVGGLGIASAAVGTVLLVSSSGGSGKATTASAGRSSSPRGPNLSLSPASGSSLGLWASGHF